MNNHVFFGHSTVIFTQRDLVATVGVARQAEVMTGYATTLSDLLSMFKLESAVTALPNDTKMLKAR